MRTAIAIVAAAVVGTLAGAQQPPFKRTIVQQGDLSAPGREVVSAVVEFQPGASPGRHTHFGEEVGYVIEGSIVVHQDGKPDVPVKAGQAFLIPAGAVHDATNGPTVGRILATYIVEKGKPLATPVK